MQLRHDISMSTACASRAARPKGACATHRLQIVRALALSDMLAVSVRLLLLGVVVRCACEERELQVRDDGAEQAMSVMLFGESSKKIFPTTRHAMR